MPATLVYNHTEQTSWTRAMTNQADLFDNDSLSGPGGYAWSDSLWITSLSATPELVVTPALAESSSIAWKFYGTSGDDKTGTGQLWGVNKLEAGGNPEYMGDFLCKFGVTTGGTSVSSTGEPFSSILPTCNLVDTITVDADHSLLPGARVVSGGDDGAAVLVLDGMGYKYYILEMATGTATGLGALYRVF